MKADSKLLIKNGKNLIADWSNLKLFTTVIHKIVIIEIHRVAKDKEINKALLKIPFFFCEHEINIEIAPIFNYSDTLPDSGCSTNKFQIYILCLLKRTKTKGRKFIERFSRSG